MPRIMVVGYINTLDLDDHLVDLTHPTGLTEEGYDRITSLFSDEPYKIALSDLEDLDLTLED